MITKTKNLSPLEFLDVLQQEYYISEIRAKISVSIKDKEFYRKLMGYKKEKIENIAMRNQIDSIFSSEEIRNEYIKKIYPLAKGGLPQFELTEKDIKNYYIEGSDVRFLIDNKKFVGKIETVNFEKNFAFLKVKGKKEKRVIKLHELTRIL